ncbi:hypothetical protein J2Y58_001167 [Sphingomonas sp. BE138]|uniref:hypothetical protein n=1 Tax=Sphingomonas sp. BE138 TaxID=2817845 RepID=UPI002865D473|nr:hypothetical protein [Sphingomonas sp. BE138]MDR6787815.1 hypothetical protein [Sphingomonas sp. BE138]
MSGYRPAFEAGLRLLARASELMERRGFARPVLVGGGAVELYTQSAVTTGDFDVVTPRQEAFEEALLQLGFVQPAGTGHVPNGWLHPELLLGFEVVASTLLDGAADPNRLLLLDMGDDGRVSIIAVEDVIADRMGQYASGSAPDMLEQARALFALHRDADVQYLDARIRYETAGSHGIADLKQS